MTRRTRKPTTLPLGTISEGTLRPEDLIPAFLSALDDVRLSKAERATVRQVQARINAVENGTYNHAQDLEYWESCDSSDDLEELTAILDAHCPDYTDFGTLEGDGTHFGVWPHIEQLEEDSITRDRYLDPHDPRSHTASVVKVNAGDPFPKARAANGCEYVMSVTDHGNVTLYRRSGTRWIEVWSVV